MNLKYVTFFYWALLFSFSTHAATNLTKEPLSVSTWQDINAIHLTVEDNQNSWKANWLIKIDKEKNTVLIEKDDYFHGQNLKGTLIVLAGKTMLSKGLILRKGDEIDALDTPIIMMQLLIEILHKTSPDGPSSVTKATQIDHTETNIPIHISTKSASAHFNAPWSVTGLLSKAKRDTIDYDFSFVTSVNDGINYILKMSGHLAQRSGLSLDNTMTLDGWQIYQLGPNQLQEGETTSFHYGAQLIQPTASTLGELREQLRH